MGDDEGVAGGSGHMEETSMKLRLWVSVSYRIWQVRKLESDDLKIFHFGVQWDHNLNKKYGCKNEFGERMSSCWVC